MNKKQQEDQVNNYKTVIRNAKEKQGGNVQQKQKQNNKTHKKTSKKNKKHCGPNKDLIFYI